MATKRQMLNKLQGSESVSSAITPTTSLPSGALPQMQTDSSADILAKSLGNFGNNLRRAQAANEKKRLEEQKELVPMYAEMVKKQYNIESIEDIPSKVQLREDGFMPEDSMVVSTQIIQSLGKKFGKEFMLEKIEGVRDEDGNFIEGKEGLSNEIRNNPEALNDWIRSTKEELFDTVGDKPFMSAGALEGADAEAEIIVNIARQQRANYHRGLDTEHFVEEIEDVIATSSPEELVANIKALDAERGLTGSLNNLERKKTLVATMITEATANRDTSLLDALQKAGFGGGSTQADIDAARRQIPNLQLDDMRRDEERLALEAAQGKREGTALVNDLVNKNDTEGIKALRDKHAGQSDLVSLHIIDQIEIAEEAAKTPLGVSAGNVVILSEDIKLAASTGDYTKFGIDGEATDEQLVELIQNRTDIREKQKAELILKIPVMKQGYRLVRSSESNNKFRNSFSDTISILNRDPRIFFLNSAGINVNTTVRSVYEQEVTDGITAVMTETDEPPTPSQMTAIYNTAVEKAGAKLSDLRGLMDGIGDDQEEIEAYMNQTEEQDVTGQDTGNKDDPNSANFEPEVGKIYTNFKDGKEQKFRWTGNGAGLERPMDKDNWEAVTETDTPEKKTTIASDADIAEIQANQAKAAEEQSATQQAEAYKGLGEIFNRDTQEFTLSDEVRNRLETRIKSLGSNNTLQGVSDSEIKEVVLKELGLEDNEFFDYGFLDFADEDGEIGLKKLIRDLRQK